MRDIGKNIRVLREKKGMTQEALAEALFVTRQTVSNYETGRSQPDLDTLVRLAALYQVPVEELIYGRRSERRAVLLRRAAWGVVIGYLVLLLACSLFLLAINTVLPPATAADKCLLRTSYMATLTEELLDEAIEVFAGELAEVSA